MPLTVRPVWRKEIAPPKTYTAHGHSANFCFVIPEWNMVVVRMGTSPIGRIPEGEGMWNTFFAKVADALSLSRPRQQGGPAGPASP